MDVQRIDGDPWPKRGLIVSTSIPEAISWLAWVCRQACSDTRGNLSETPAGAIRSWPNGA